MSKALPLNRIVAFLGPYVAIGSGIVATWLTSHLHVLATFHITNNQVANVISQAVVFGVSALVVWLGHQKWLTGWIAWEQANIATNATSQPNPRAAAPARKK